MPFSSYGRLGSDAINVVFNERERDVSAVAQLETGKLQGRWRNTGANARAVPSSSADVLSGDALGDMLYDSSYLYVCLLIGGTLTWCRIALATSW